MAREQLGMESARLGRRPLQSAAHRRGLNKRVALRAEKNRREIALSPGSLELIE